MIWVSYLHLPKPLNRYSMPKILRRIFILASYFVFFVSSLFSQDVKFTRIGSDQGLSQASVNCILQVSKGFIWFGTQDGLNKFDGYSNDMVVYKHDHADSNSLSNNYIECLYEDKSGIIWVGTRSGGLNAFNPIFNTFTHFENDSKNEKSINGNQVKCIFQDKTGTYWVGTTFGLNSFNGRDNNFTKYKSDTNDSLSLKGVKVESVYEDKKGYLWICTMDGGLNLFNSEKKNFTCYLNQSVDRTGAKFYIRPKMLMEDTTGAFWVATDNGGVAVFDPETKKYIQHIALLPDSSKNSIPENRISSLCFDGKGFLWMATKNSGISLLNQHSGSIVNYKFNEYDFQSLSSNGINCVYKDKQGNIWIGTEGGGVSVYFPDAVRFKHFRKNILNEKDFQSNTIFGILQDRDGLIWAGTMHGGITTIDRINNLYHNYGYGANKSPSTAKSNSVLALFEDKDGLIWVGTWGGGLNTFDKKTGVVSRIIEKGTITCIAQGQGDLIWIGSFGLAGLYSYNKSSKELIAYSSKDGLRANRVLCIYEDADKRVWIGTSGEGLNMIDYGNNKSTAFKYLKNENCISDNTVNCIFDDHKGNLWIGTSSGLNKFEIKSRHFTQYTEKDGLPNGNVWGILADKKDNLWLSTNKGISRFNPKEDNAGRSAFKNFTRHDGLQGDEFAQGSYFFNKQTGEMFFGGLNGFNAFYPDRISDNKHIPSVFITSFKKLGKEAQLDSSISCKKYITISHKDNFVSFEFVALDYLFPEKNTYSFKMEGLDDDWSPPSSRHYVSYTSMPGGDYVFRVKASNSDGVWNEEGVSIHVKVVPPWWRTNIFYSFCVLFSIVFVFVFIRYRTDKIEKEKKVLEQKVAQRTNELAQKNHDITSSIQYAMRIQQAILPTKEQVLKYFPESFILYKPKDIVSGDFYWYGEKNGRSIAACVDCTGHGVPGAFMSMIGANLLNQIILENGITEPAAILSALNKGVRTALKQGVQSEIKTTDGMDIALCSIDLNKREVQFSSALRHLVIVSGNNLEKISGDKLFIGGSQPDSEVNFTNHIKFLNKGDMIYMFSDGYADQFGGDKGKKLMIKKLHESLLAVSILPVSEQKNILDKTFEDWRGNYNQVDDVLVLGIRL